MKVDCYLRVARSTRGIMVAATLKPSSAPLMSSSNVPYATRQFKLVLNLPDGAFRGIDGTVEIDVPEGALSRVIQAEVEVPE